MAANRVQIELDEELVLRARARVSRTDVSDSDSDLIADVVAEWLAFATLNALPVPGLAPDEADALAVAEVRAHRASRDSAA